MTKDVKAVKSTSKGVKLTEKQKRFVEEYLIDLNATQAAIRAGYSEKTAKSIGQRLLTFVDVQTEIKKAQKDRSTRTQITQDEVLRDLQELRDICMGRKPIRITEVIKNSQQGTADAVTVEVTAFEPHAANKALDLLGKHLGMFKDKLDVTTNGQSLPAVIQVSFSDEPDEES